MPLVEVLFNYEVAGAAPEGTTFTGTAISDRVVQLVDAAAATIDLAAYNFDHAPLAAALRRAHDRGVRVRVVTDIDTRHPSLLSPTPNYFWIAVNDEGLMHHKFLVVDAGISGSEVVVTGSTNFTDANIYRFYNDAVLLRSRELAAAFTQEFELMWGSDTAVPNAAAGRSGADKPVRLRPRVVLEGTDVEVYFSPNQEVSERIVEEIDRAQESIGFQLLILTYDDIAQALVRAHDRGVGIFGVVENFDDNSSEVFYLQGQGVPVEGHTPEEVVHHKYGVFDAEAGDASTLITGSHNWTYSAETFHDENTLVVTGSAALSELYHRAARDRYCALVPASDCVDVVADVSAPTTAQADVRIGPNPTRGAVTITTHESSSAALEAYRLIDASGRLVQGGQLSRSSASHALDLSHLRPAAYVLQLRTAAGWTAGTPLLLSR